MTTEFMQLQFAREAISRAILHLDEALGREMNESLQLEIAIELTVLKNSRRTVNDLVEKKRAKEAPEAHQAGGGAAHAQE